MSPIFHELVDILFHVLKNEVQVIVDSDDFFQLDDRKLSTFGFLGGKGKVKLRENEVIVNLLD